MTLRKHRLFRTQNTITPQNIVAGFGVITPISKCYLMQQPFSGSIHSWHVNVTVVLFVFDGRQPVQDLFLAHLQRDHPSRFGVDLSVIARLSRSNGQCPLATGRYLIASSRWLTHLMRFWRARRSHRRSKQIGTIGERL